MRVSLAPFSTAARYIASRPMVLAGDHLNPGDPIPATIEARRVRQLYEGRRAVMAPLKAPKIQSLQVGPPARQKGNR